MFVRWYGQTTVLCKRAKDAGYGLPNFVVNGTCTYPDLILGENNLIFDNTYIGHDFNIGNHVYVSPGVKLAGHCEIADLSFLGMGSNVKGGLRLGAETLLGAGSLLLSNTEEHGLYLGSPARLVRDHVESGIHIK